MKYKILPLFFFAFALPMIVGCDEGASQKQAQEQPEGKNSSQEEAKASVTYLTLKPVSIRMTWEDALNIDNAILYALSIIEFDRLGSKRNV